MVRSTKLRAPVMGSASVDLAAQYMHVTAMLPNKALPEPTPTACTRA